MAMKRQKSRWKYLKFKKKMKKENFVKKLKCLKINWNLNKKNTIGLENKLPR